MHKTCYKALRLAVIGIKFAKIAASFLVLKALDNYLRTDHSYYSFSKKLG